ncbi:Transcription initiation factor IIA subunit 2, partial [Ananas comosus]
TPPSLPPSLSLSLSLSHFHSSVATHRSLPRPRRFSILLPLSRSPSRGSAIRRRARVSAPGHARPEISFTELVMATFELYRRSSIGMCLTETLDEMVSNGTLSPELAIQVLVQFDKSMTDALENQVKTKVSIKGHLHTYRFCDNVWTFILQDAMFKSDEMQEQVGRVKIVACDSKLLTQ